MPGRRPLVQCGHPSTQLAIHSRREFGRTLGQQAALILDVLSFLQHAVCEGGRGKNATRQEVIPSPSRRVLELLLREHQVPEYWSSWKAHTRCEAS